MCMDLYIIRKYTGFRVWEFITGVVLKSIFLILIVVFCTIFISCKNFDMGFTRLVITTVSSTMLLLPLIFLLGLTPGERHFVRNLVFKKMH